MVAEAVVETSRTRVVQEEPRPILWTTEQFQQMGELGLFEGRHAELIEGEILEMTVGTAHFTGVMRVVLALGKGFGSGFYVRPQGPLNVNQRTDPEPDVAVVEGALEDYKDTHPTTALLIVEVSDTSLRYDQGSKASLYARAGIPDYWIVNLVDNQLEVRRQPVQMPDQPFGFGYAQIAVLAKADSVTPLAAPNVTLAVTDLLP